VFRQKVSRTIDISQRSHRLARTAAA